jgi:hypothetical protein
LDIYYNSSPIDSDTCDLIKYKETVRFDRYLYGIRIYGVTYPKTWCPYFFKDFDLAHLILLDIINSFLIKNRLNFYNLNSSKVYLEYLFVLELSFIYEHLDEKNLSPDLFHHVKYLSVSGVLNGIQSELFKTFRYLKVIDLGISNLKQLFYGGNKWMNSLNPIEKSFFLIFRNPKGMTSFDSIYEYLDEDLCLFKDFPHEKRVYPHIMSGKKLECSCTLYWLQSNLFRFGNGMTFMTDYSLNYQDDYKEESLRKMFLFCNKTFNWTKCNLKKKFSLCQIVEYDSDQSFHKISFNNDFDVFYIIKFVEFILLVILQPILTIFGIILNASYCTGFA